MRQGQKGKKDTPQGEALAMRISRKLSLSTASVALAFLASATPALAETHPFLFSFGSFTNPNGIAVEESTGDVYVADIGTNTVSRFDADGNPVEFSALHSNTLAGVATPAGSFSFPSADGTPAAIAIDNSSSQSDPSAGDLYVMDAGHSAIDKFNAKGEYLNQIAVNQISGQLSGELTGFAVEANGDIRVMVTIGLVERMSDLFDNSAANDLVDTLKETESHGLPGMDGFAVGQTGDVQMLFLSCGCAKKYGGSLVGGRLATRLNQVELGKVDSGPGAVAAAVDPVSGHLYIDDQSSVAEWDTGAMNGFVTSPTNGLEEISSGALVSRFASLQLSSFAAQQGGIAVDGARGEVYVANPADGKVYVFASTPPAVTAGVAANVSQTGATLQGSVDPRGVAVTSCELEYERVPERPAAAGVDVTMPATVFSHSVPCAQSPGEIGGGTSPVGVSADIGGLLPGVLYDFRLLAGDANGTSLSEGRFATAGSGFGIKSFEVAFVNGDGTRDTQAGSHPNTMVTNFAFNTKAQRENVTADSRYVIRPDGNVKDIIVVPPPGFVGDPNATELKCTLRELETIGTEGQNNCAAGSQVGELDLEFATIFSIKEPLFNMVAPRGVAAQLGGNFIIPKAFVSVGLQTGGQYPVQAESLGVPAIEAITEVRTTLFGVVGSGEHRKPFLTLPTGCTGPLRSSISVDSYQNPGHYVSMGAVTRDAGREPVSLTGCSKLKFPPAITVAPDVSDASSSSGLTVSVHVPQTAALNPDGLAESALRDTTVALPAGMSVNPAGADGLLACSEGLAGFTGFREFNPESEPGVETATFSPAPIESLEPGVSFCPDGSKIGTVKIKTPLLPNALEGAVYLAAQDENPFGSLIAMYMMVEDPVSGSTVKLAGEVQLCESAGQVVSGVSCQGAGQLVTTFKNTPDVPFEDLELHFFGGERAPLRTPSRCGTYTTQASFAPWDGNAPVNTSSSFQITSGPNGSACPGASLPFSPSLTAGTSSNQAGGFTPFTMTMSRPDGSQNLQAVALNMPAGLSGLLTGVELCPEPQAGEGLCGPGSLIGETTVSVGVGGKPFSVKGGRVYITGPYQGAPFGLSIVNPAKAGPYDLEKGSACDCVLVRARIEVDPLTAALTVTSDNSGPFKIPTILKGIPLEIQHVNVTINRPGFTFNPTNCNPMSITGNLSSTEGSSQSLAVAFQATNCAALGFAPKFAVATSGKTSKANGASLSVSLAYPKAPFGSQANIKQVKVELPKQLPSRLTTLQKACTAAQFKANPAGCPAASVVGHAKAITPLIPVPLEGPAYFVSNGGEAFPNLIVVLQGYGVRIDLVGDTFISKAGVTSSTFKTVPDAPVGSFELTLPQGRFSALTANANLCALTRTVLVKKKITVRIRGHKHTLTRRVKETQPAPLSMPTEFLAQNGATIHQNTPITITGCTKATKAKKKRHRRAGTKGHKKK
jgi:DNA-binding beta-propeller fold protein YncE